MNRFMIRAQIVSAVALLAAALLSTPAVGQQGVQIRFGTVSAVPNITAEHSYFWAEGGAIPTGDDLITTEETVLLSGLGLFDPDWGTLNSVSLQIIPQVDYTATADFTGPFGGGSYQFLGNLTLSVRIPQPIGTDDIVGQIYSMSADPQFMVWPQLGIFDPTTDPSVGTQQLGYQLRENGGSAIFVNLPGTTQDYVGEGMFEVNGISTLSADIGPPVAFQIQGFTGDRLFEGELEAITTNQSFVTYNFDSATLLAGDVDLNGIVNEDDADIVRDNFGEVLPYWNEGDVTQDGVVNKLDAFAVRSNLGAGAGAAVPEPSSLCLIAMGGIVFFRRRR